MPTRFSSMFPAWFFERSQKSPVALVAVVFFNIGCGSPAPTPARTATPASEQTSAEPVSQTPRSEQSGPRPPDFELDALDGSSVRLSHYVGTHVVLIDFWATFCDPCLVAMPHLDEIYRRHKDENFVVLGVSIDGPESLGQVRTQVQRTGVTFPILLDRESTVLSKYNPKSSAPFSVLIGRDGRILKKQEGYTTGSARELEAEIEQALLSQVPLR